MTGHAFFAMEGEYQNRGGMISLVQPHLSVAHEEERRRRLATSLPARPYANGGRQGKTGGGVRFPRWPSRLGGKDGPSDKAWTRSFRVSETRIPDTVSAARNTIQF